MFCHSMQHCTKFLELINQGKVARVKDKIKTVEPMQ
jgi:hypothetical protein